ncbi:MAG: hypothetical protein LBP25_02740 [Tannerellaceae bacterium]|jgi:hypothetical protein|nr:hypothetical protein [Tannerellaceae bacterium]
MNRQLLKIVLLAIASLFSFQVFAQENALIGREFYFAAWPNLGQESDPITLVVFSYGDGTVNVAGTDYTVSNGVPLTLTLTLTSYVKTLSLKITSNVDIVAYAGILGTIAYRSADATALLPTQSLGTEYRIFQYPIVTNTYKQTYRVIATQPQTKVYANGSLIANLANAGDVYVSNTVYSTDLTGTRITADKPVAVFSGTFGSKYLSDHEDMLIEQMWPIPTWGKEYVLPRLGSEQNNCRIISDESASVTVTVKTANNADTTLTVPANGYAEFQFDDLTRITANAPIAVAQYTTGVDNPSMMWVNPVEQRVVNARLARLNDWEGYVTILTRKQDFDQTAFTVNGVSKPFTSVIAYDGIPGWKVGRYKLLSGETWIDASNSNGLTATIEGYGEDRSYIYAAAGGTLNLLSYFTVTTQTQPYNDTHYSATSAATHTFGASDVITVKRTIEQDFTKVSWLIHGAPYSVPENTNATDTLTFPASAFHCGKDSITMKVRYKGATADSLYTGYVWIDKPYTASDISANDTVVCSGQSATLKASAAAVANPVFKWYDANSIFLGEGASYTTPALTATTKYYVSVLSGGKCENKPEERKEVTVTVPKVKVNSIGNIERHLETIVPAINFTASPALPGVTYKWENNNTHIGLKEKGEGNIPEFKAKGIGRATITVTPYYNDCPGTSTKFVITVFYLVPINPHLRSNVIVH